MWIPNIGQTTGLLLGAAVAVAASPVQAADNYILGTCRVSQPGLGLDAEIGPTVDGDSYLVYYHADDPRYKGFSFNSGNTKVSLVKAPAHGKVERDNSGISSNRYRYMPNEGYYGQDRFVMQVEKNGVKVEVPSKSV